MGFFRRTPPPRITDPVLGTLEYHKGRGWEGAVAVPGEADPVLVSFERGPEGPTEKDREVVARLLSRYPSLVPALRDALFLLWNPMLALPDWEGPRAATPDALWSIVQLNCILLPPTGPAELLFAFRGDVWPDAMFTVAIDGDSVTGISLDD